MSHTQTDAPRMKFSSNDLAVPGEPFTRLRYHYGMLLAAEDFGIEQQYHLLQRRLHQSALHGWGTVCGLEVVDQKTDGVPDRMVVQPGLAVDRLGRNIYIGRDQCLAIEGLANQHPEIWDQLHPPESAGEADGANDDQALEWPEGRDGPALLAGSLREAFVVLRYESCLSEPVPAVEQPCGQAERGSIYSRIIDRFRIDLMPSAPDIPPRECGVDWSESTGREENEDSDGPGLPSSMREAILRAVLDGGQELDALWQDYQDAPLLLARVELANLASEDRTVVYRIDNGVRALLPRAQHLAEQQIGEHLRQPSTREPFKALDVRAKSTAETFELTLALTHTPHEGTARAGVQVRVIPAGLPADASWAELEADQFEVRVDTNRLSIVIGESDVDILEELELPLDVQVSISGRTAPVLDERGEPFAGMWNEPTPDRGRGRDYEIIRQWMSSSDDTDDED